MKPMYIRMVDIGNQGSKDLGFDGLSDLWFSKYDMPAEEFLARNRQSLGRSKASL